MKWREGKKAADGVMRRPHEDDERARSGVRVRGLLVSLYLHVCVRQAAMLSSDTRTTSQNKNSAATMSTVMVTVVLRPRSVFYQDGQPVQDKVSQSELGG